MRNNSTDIIYMIILFIVLMSILIIPNTLFSKSNTLQMTKNCLDYNYTFDEKILGLQISCLSDLYGEQRNIPFCDMFIGVNESSDSTLKLYNWSK